MSGILALPDGPHAAASVLGALAAAGDLAAWTVFTGWLVGAPPAWLDGLKDGGGMSVMGGSASRAAVEDGRLRYLPVRLSNVPKILQQLQPEVTVVRARPHGRGFRMSPSAGWAVTACRVARRVVVEVDRSLPIIEAPEVPGDIALVVDAEEPSFRPPRVVPDEVEQRIGASVAGLLPEGSTVQHGPGGIAAAVLAAIDRPVRVFSGMLSDALLGLHERGLLKGPAIAAYLYGGEALEELAASGAARITGVEETHDLGRVQAMPRFVALNTAVQVGLDGAVNVESVGGRSIAGIGGHPDYAFAAAGSAGGLSVVALRSTRGGRGASTIVPMVERVSTSPTDIEVVVTEHGVADLRGLDRRGRAEALVAVADPAHRDLLAEGAAR